MKDDYSDLDIPDFLKIPQERRRQAWLEYKPKIVPTVAKKEESEETRKFREELENVKNIKSKVYQEKRRVVIQDRKNIDSGKVWNTDKARWEDADKPVLSTGLTVEYGKKKRGRPRKSQLTMAPTPVMSTTGKKRGRPVGSKNKSPKVFKIPTPIGDALGIRMHGLAGDVEIKRGRGRPKGSKNKPKEK